MTASRAWRLAALGRFMLLPLLLLTDTCKSRAEEEGGRIVASWRGNADEADARGESDAAPPEAVATFAPPVAQTERPARGPKLAGTPLDRMTPPDAELPRPSEAEWKTAPRVVLLHEPDECEARLVRGWLRVDCDWDDPIRFEQRILVETEQLPDAGIERYATVAVSGVVVPLRRGAMNVVEVVHLTQVAHPASRPGAYVGVGITSPGYVLSTSWIDGSGPLASMLASASAPSDDERVERARRQVGGY
jgi:hypothetical protein